MPADKNTNSEISADIKEGKIFAVIAYWFFLCALPLILRKDNKFAVYHGKQGLVLFIFFVAGFVLSVLPVIGGILFHAVLYIYLVLFVWGSIQALLGNYARIPLVSNIAEKIII